MQISRRRFLGSSAALLGSSCLLAKGFAAEINPYASDKSLRGEGLRRGIKIGAAVSSEQLTRDIEFRNALLRDCALLVPEWELNWTTVRRNSGQFDFGGMDTIVRFASANSLVMRGHPLIWHGGMPDWAVSEIYGANAYGMLESHIKTTLARYAGRVLSWDVVNEAVKPEDGIAGGLRDTPWLRSIGPDYIEKAFRVAAVADPLAKLVYNDYNVEYEEPKARAIVSLIKRLKDKGVPIHAVGLQSHLWATKRKLNLTALRDFCRAIVREGLEIIITELDVRENDFWPGFEERDRRVASVVESYLDTVFSECVPKELVLWGLSDRYSWLSKPKYNPENPTGVINRGLPYDNLMSKKQLWQLLMGKVSSLPITGK